MSKDLTSLLQWYQENGCEYLFSEESSDLLADSAPIASLTADNKQVSPVKYPAAFEARTLAEKCNSIAELKSAIDSFNGCLIKQSANKTVLGDGNIDAQVMLIGEAPGANEDKEGIPFCGQSGKLLDNIIKSIGLTRGEVYIGNTVFWRPPGTRRPTIEEIAICRPFVEKHIALVNPKLLILVGSTAVEALLEINEPISGLRQRRFDYENSYIGRKLPSVVIYHPSYLLRQPYKKKEMWHDMQYIKLNYLDSL